MTLADFEKNAELPAPGVCDDGSGTAAVMELARVMSQYEFDKTIAFVTFAGEEQGLIGSSLQAVKAKKENQAIEAVLNNDIIGTDVAGNGRMGNGAVNIYSDETMDSVSQQLSRYVREVGERYLPSMKINTVFMGDRLGRGGDHTPFQWEGFAAVRVSTPNEIYANQHRATDTLANMSVPYTAKVAKVNLIAAANLALAPKPPIVMPEPRAGGGRQGGGDSGSGGRRRTASHADDRARRRLRRGAALARGGSGRRHQRLRDCHSSNHVAVLGTGNLRRQGEYVHAERCLDRRREIRREGDRRQRRGEPGDIVRLSAAAKGGGRNCAVVASRALRHFFRKLEQRVAAEIHRHVVIGLSGSQGRDRK